MGSHYTTHPTQPAIMTREHLEQCRHLLGNVPEWVERECDIRSVESQNFKRREVVGQGYRVRRESVVDCAGRSDGEYNITTPTTLAARQWQGWGTALKPALEPITMARKPIVGTVAANVVEHGTGAINVDGCRVGDAPAGRWPANLIHDDGDEVQQVLGDASRFFYCPKASKSDRDEGLEEMPEVHRVNGNKWTDQDYRVINGERPETAESGPRKNIHPTVKPTDLMRYLCRLVTQPGGVVLDPFMGSGSTGKAAVLEGFRFVGIERDETYFEIAKRRILNTEAKQEPSSKQGELW